MICRPCAIGADIAVKYRTAPGESFLLTVLGIKPVTEEVEKAHGECVGIGCTCQHQINLEREVTA